MVRRSLLPSADSGRAVTFLERDGQPFAAILHDEVLLDDPALVASVASAVRLSVENDRLQAEAEAQLGEVRESRARIVEAGDAERKRVERDLHDGAQQRLVSPTLALRLARLKLGTTRTRTSRAASMPASEEARSALAELRELARGIHPQILTEAGLGLGHRVARSSLVGGRCRRPPHRPAVLADGGGDRLLRRIRGARERCQVRRSHARPRANRLAR